MSENTASSATDCPQSSSENTIQAPWGDIAARASFSTTLAPEAAEKFIADHQSVVDLLAYNLFLSFGILTEEQYISFADLYGIGQVDKLLAVLKSQCDEGLLIRQELPVPCIVMPGSIRALLRLCLPEMAWAIDVLPNATTDAGQGMSVAAIGRYILRNFRVLNYLRSIQRSCSREQFLAIAASVQTAMSLAQADICWQGKQIPCALAGFEQSPARAVADRTNMRAAILADWNKRTGKEDGLRAHGGGLLMEDGRLKPMAEIMKSGGTSQKRILDRAVAKEIGALICFSEMPAGCLLVVDDSRAVPPALDASSAKCGVPVYTVYNGHILVWQDGWKDEAGQAVK